MQGLMIAYGATGALIGAALGVYVYRLLSMRRMDRLWDQIDAAIGRIRADVLSRAATADRED